MALRSNHVVDLESAKFIESVSVPASAAVKVVNPDGSNLGGGTSYADGSSASTPTGSLDMWSDGGTSPATIRAVTQAHPMPVTLYNAASVAVGINSTAPMYAVQARLVAGYDEAYGPPLTPVTVTITGNASAQQLIAAPSTTHHLEIYKFMMTQTSTVATRVGARELVGGSDAVRTYLSSTPGDAKAPTFPGPWVLTGSTAPSGLFTCSQAAGSVVDYTIWARTVTDS